MSDDTTAVVLPHIARAVRKRYGLFVPHKMLFPVREKSNPRASFALQGDRP